MLGILAANKQWFRWDLIFAIYIVSKVGKHSSKNSFLLITLNGIYKPAKFRGASLDQGQGIQV